MSFDRERPYNLLPLLPPTVELETKAVLKKAITANRVLAELKGAGNVLPHQAILINSIVLQESRASSEIENIVTTQDELYQADTRNLNKSSPEAKEVHHYRQALWAGFEEIQERALTINTMIQVVQTIKEARLDVRKQPGTKIGNSLGETIYTPPEGEQVIRDKLANLENFIHADDDLDPLVKLAIIHYQFEAIHPFTDGNGRTGRILNLLYLVEKKLLDIPVLFLSGYIIANRNQYYAGLREVTEQGNWEGWILYMLDAVEQTSIETRLKIDAIRELIETTADIVREQASEVYSKDLIEAIFHHPYCKIQFLVESGIVKRQSASKYLNTLADIGVLTKLKSGRENYFINHRLVALLR